MPLAVKLWMRDILAADCVDRESMTEAAALEFVRAKMRAEDPWRFRGKLPWQPQVYDGVRERAAASEFTAALRPLEDVFLGMRLPDQRLWAERPAAFDVPAAFRRILGSPDAPGG